MCLAVPGKLTQVSDVEPLLRSGRVDFGGIFKDVCLAVLPEAVPGDYVLVHAGIAIARIDEQEAFRVLDYLREIDGLEEPAE
jgi:hydrogenase expression/formation protein HypC